MDMKRNRRNHVRRERIVMLASSAFVLAALTMTGLYMKDKNAEIKDDGYTIDFTTMEKSVDDKLGEIAKNQMTDNSLQQITDNQQAQGNQSIQRNQTAINNQPAQGNMEDDLDYMPLEAGSSLVEIPGLTMQEDTDREEAGEDDDHVTKEEETGKDSRETSVDNAIVSKELTFAEDTGLTRPVKGEILMPYSMDSSIYFATLDQYKYNPAVIFKVEENTAVGACAEAKVLDIYEDAEIGRAVRLDLGSGYEAVYGQLKEIWVVEGAYVNPGDTIGTVSSPTKYYSVEGNNLYFALTKDGVAKNPEELFK